MKKLYSVILLFAGGMFAQNQHPCAVSKMKSLIHLPVVSQAHRDLENMYDVKFNHLNVHVERTTTDIDGSVRTLALITAPVLDTFAFELHSDLVLDSVYLFGANFSFIRNQNEVRVPLAFPQTAGVTIDATIYYHGTPPSAGSAAIGNGFSNATSGSWGNQCTWSLSEAYVAEEWWPCKQSLQDKIDSCWVWITTDTSNKAGSNGLLQNITDLGNGKHRYEWRETHVIDYYLISVAVAKYVEYNVYAHPANSPDSILVQNYVYDNPATLTNFKPQLDAVPSYIELFSNLFGLYPFADEKYGHCMAPFGGGMEHQTMTSIGFFDNSTDAHELGHQWFGDHVTCSTWNDIWINEGWASYCEYLYRQYLVSATSALNHMNSVHSNVMSAAGGSVWCNDTTDVNRIFDSRLSYDKGAAFIHTLRFEINNDTTFFNACKTFQQTFGNSTASGESFKQTLENVSGLNFAQSFNQWYYGEGYPTFAVRWNQTGSYFYMTSNQTVSMASVTPLFMTDIEYKIKRSSPYTDTIVRVYHGQANEFYSFNIPGTVTTVVIDPNQWILNNGSVVHDPSLVGIEQTEKLNDIKIYPNPAKEIISFQSNFNNGTYDVIDLTGKNIFTGKISSTKTTVPVSGFNNGIYFVVLKDKDGRVAGSSKFVVAD